MTPKRQHVIDEIDRVARELRDRVAQLDLARSHVATGGGLKGAMRLVERFDPSGEGNHPVVVGSSQPPAKD